MKSLKTLSALKKFIVVGTASVLCSTMLALPSVSATPGSDFTTAYSATTGTLLTESLWMGVVNKLGTVVDQIAAFTTSGGKLKIAASTETCDGTNAGAIRYEGTAVQYCNGASWSAMGGATADTTPNAITFTNQTEVNTNTAITSNPVTVSGFEGPLTAYCTNCTVQKGAGAFASSVDGFMPGDTITIKVTSSSSDATAVTATVALGNTTSSVWSVTTPMISGGTITTVGGYKYHTFTSNGTLVVGASKSVEYLVVAGGGGSTRGGGGAGGLRSGSATLVLGNYNVVVGAGGAGGANYDGAKGSNGSPSSFNGVTTVGGGAGGGTLADSGCNGNNGGSGGGGGYNCTPGTAGTGVAGEGYAGGVMNSFPGGGGGAGGPGYSGGGSAAPSGGLGVEWPANSGVYYAGGGAGWSMGNGCGGSGVGGDSDTCATGPKPPTPNRGGGGAMHNNPPYGGATGVVIVRYLQ